jgi:hypothetical protein
MLSAKIAQGSSQHDMFASTMDRTIEPNAILPMQLSRV